MVETIHIDGLQDACQLSPVRCADFAEAAAVCLDHHGHPKEVVLAVEGDWEEKFTLSLPDVDQQMRDSRKDMEYTVESGAYCLAMMVIEKLTGLQVVKQSQKRTGFDYWLGDKQAYGLQELARLEVSGILRGNKAQVNRRLKEKVEQTKKSDNLSLPAYVVVMEFSRPLVKIRKR